MNEQDAALYAEEKGVIDGYAKNWDPPFRRTYAPNLGEIYEQCYWMAFAIRVSADEFPNG